MFSWTSWTIFEQVILAFRQVTFFLLWLWAPRGHFPCVFLVLSLKCSFCLLTATEVMKCSFCSSLLNLLDLKLLFPFLLGSCFPAVIFWYSNWFCLSFKYWRILIPVLAELFVLCKMQWILITRLSFLWTEMEESSCMLTKHLTTIPPPFHPDCFYVKSIWSDKIAVIQNVSDLTDIHLWLFFWHHG